ncbi:MAG TPA: carboxylating nicotinate-nucleotide diphosphorylase [Thermoplasmata archaeon]|nr:carboxylating nicotinate-nucleotide diphosphorylase [Thermoplasmata archaeon]
MRSKIHEYLREDIGSGDITSELLVSPDQKARGRIIAKERCVLAGAAEASEVFKELGARAVMRRKDGASVKKGDFILGVSGPARSLLAGERLALNFLMRMSGIATVTSDMVDKCREVNPHVRVAATRKTVPGFREFEKKAVVLGGGDPHRFGLDDAILIKDNHINVAGSVHEALKRAKRSSFTKKIEIEVECEKDAFAALEAGADIIMLDNFGPGEARELYSKLKERCPDILVEVSGGITPENIARYADAADIISVGWITHSVRSVDFSMSIERA